MQTTASSRYATSLPSMHHLSQSHALGHEQRNTAGIGVNDSAAGSGSGGSILLPTPSEPLRASVMHLLARAYNIPCSAASQAFTQLVQPTARFQLALEAILPLLTGNNEIPQRILASYILYSLYAAHPISMNPFRSAFIDVFSRERALSKVESERGVANENEQFVWVLWKILRGDGTDLSPYSPVTLARSPIPPKLRAPYLTIDDLPAADLDLDHESDGRSLRSFSTRSSGSSMSISSESATSSIGGETPSPPEQPTISPSFYTNLNGKTAGGGMENGAGHNERVLQAVKFLSAAKTRVLSLSDQRLVLSTIAHLPNSVLSAADLPALIGNNPTIAHTYIVSTLRAVPADAALHTISAYCDALKTLPPTLTTLDVLGRLLRDNTSISAVHTGAQMSVAHLIRSEVFGTFVLNAIEWIERAEKDEAEGLVSDDRAAKAVQNLCRFFNSLIKLNIVDPSSDTDSAAMAHFALSHSRFEEANALYRVLVMSKF